MDSITQALAALTPHRLAGLRRGIEKESLRTQPQGMLANTPHPVGLGSALTHPHITTDFSESQLELITGVHADVSECLQELKRIHQFTIRALDDEMLWVASMPCGLPADDAIPIGQYGTSNVGQAKSVYRMGLGYRYGRRMQTISGIHYNWSLPDVSDEGYFGLIRNFRRHAFLLLYLFGASPAVCSSFVQGRDHHLQSLNERTLYLPYATSLRMGRLGYQSDAQSSLLVSYNDLQGYGNSLQDALTRSYQPYEQIGLLHSDGSYKQLATSLLQIENEFYGTIRPKRVIFPGERPLHALRERGVQYIEVRLMDLDPFEPLGINSETVHFLDVFLLHCLLNESPLDTPEEIAQLGRNQQLVAQRGREPGLLLERSGASSPVTLTDWGLSLMPDLLQVAQTLDQHLDTRCYTQAVKEAHDKLLHPEKLPSARVLQAVTDQFDGSFVAFARHQSQKTKQALLNWQLDQDQEAFFAQLTKQSLLEQQQIEANDSLPFDEYLNQYLSPQRLNARRVQPA